MLLLPGSRKVKTEKEQDMTQGIDRIWQAEARIQETKQLIRDNYQLGKYLQISRINYAKNSRKWVSLLNGILRQPAIEIGK